MLPSGRTHYEVLGVHRLATTKEIKDAYLQMSKKVEKVVLLLDMISYYSQETAKWCPFGFGHDAQRALTRLCLSIIHQHAVPPRHGDVQVVGGGDGGGERGLLRPQQTPREERLRPQARLRPLHLHTHRGRVRNYISYFQRI